MQAPLSVGALLHLSFDDSTEVWGGASHMLGYSGAGALCSRCPFQAASGLLTPMSLFARGVHICAHAHVTRQLENRCSTSKRSENLLRWHVCAACKKLADLSLHLALCLGALLCPISGALCPQGPRPAKAKPLQPNLETFLRAIGLQGAGLVSGPE